MPRKTINKAVLKKIVKECLVEILAEGIGNDIDDQINEASSRLSNSRQRTVRSNSSSQQRQSEKVKLSPGSQRARQEFLNEMVAEAAGNNPVMAEMFKDTLESGRAEEFIDTSDTVVSPKDAMSQTIENMSPEEMFGDVANTWAAAAFKGIEVPEDK
jgi:hypothetical protein